MYTRFKNIKEVAEQATQAYCATADCTNCDYRHCAMCSSTHKNIILHNLVTALAIEIVKEKANESKD